MNTKKMNIMKLLGVASCLVAFMAVSCTDLEISETDSIFAESADGFNGVADVKASLENLYGATIGMQGGQDNFYALQEVSSDEYLVPTRGTDWGDNGIWRTLHNHTWDAGHGYVGTVWNQLNQNIYLASEVIDPLSGANAVDLAHAKFIRAWNMYWVMDLYGQVPFRNPGEGPEINPMVMSRTEAFAFVEKDLTEALADLPATTTWSSGDAYSTPDRSRATKAAANFMLARLYLNAHIYKGTGSPDNADLDKVIANVDAIDSYYQLETVDEALDFFEIFGAGEDSETIWFGFQLCKCNKIWNGLHYNQVTPDNGGGGWNGFTTLAEFYDSFEGPPNTNAPEQGQEPRRGFVPQTGDNSANSGIGYGFLIGQQYNANGEPILNRSFQPLVYTRELPALIGNNENTGIRMLKYHPTIDGSTWTGHAVLMRYADAHLMKAEAYLWKGDTGNALNMVNALRNARGASPLGSLSADEMLAERGREMYGEHIRRTDLIRFDKFTDSWSYKSNSGDAARNVYPIPAGALLSNPNLVQNAGY